MPANPQVTDEMVEKAARAIYEGRNGKGCKPWSLQTKSHKEPYLSDAIAALTAALADHVVGWRDIESAPKDGTPILGWSSSGVSYVCWYRKGQWIILDYPGNRHFFEPSLWMPHPPFPAAPCKQERANG